MLPLRVAIQTVDTLKKAQSIYTVLLIPFTMTLGRPRHSYYWVSEIAFEELVDRAMRNAIDFLIVGAILCQTVIISSRFDDPIALCTIKGS